jgi:predicted naringenin-chalcone synthase
MTAHLNAIGTAVPAHDVHAAFLDLVPRFLPTETDRRAFDKMARRSGIEHRYSALRPAAADARADRYDEEGFYRPRAFPSTGARMARFERDAPALAKAALDDLERREGEDWRRGITHLVVCTCTGFAAPGLEHDLIVRHGLAPTVERTIVGFMGCNAAVIGYKAARHIVRSEPSARVLVLNLELCGLHFQEGTPLATALMFMLFADGAAAAIVSAEPRGLAINGFRSEILPESRGCITWHIGDNGFDMWLSGEVPRIIARTLPRHVESLRDLAGNRPIELWAVHPGGRSILDAAEMSLALAPEDLAASRSVLRAFGNMSSATLPFVLQQMMDAAPAGRTGLAIGFGPGISVESMVFREAGA